MNGALQKRILTQLGDGPTTVKALTIELFGTDDRGKQETIRGSLRGLVRRRQVDRTDDWPRVYQLKTT